MKTANQDLSFPAVEQEIGADWEKNSTFEEQNARRESSKEFAFYDGPPFANGLPHYGHLLANTIKDVVPRYWVMKGFKVNRRFGWDCHGLPVEFEIEKREGLSGRPDILKLGIDKFNEMCRSSVLHYTSEWKKTITRLGRWVDWSDQYKTMDRDFMETVWWVFAELHRKGLVYQDFKVVPYSPRTSSVVSNFEANQNYKNTQDPSIFVTFDLLDDAHSAKLLVWTTTPWTLPSNLALAVGPDIEYVKIRDVEREQILILAEPRLDAFFGKNKKGQGGAQKFEIIERFKGTELIGKKYQPLFDYFADHEASFQILEGDFVASDSGSGIVHQAPAYGEDDFYTCKKAGIAIVDPIDGNGCFTSLVKDYEGLYFKDADKSIIKDLKEKGILLKHDTIEHSYPFDERTDTPLMFKAVPSWYVRVEQFKDKMVENNQKIVWVPSHLKNGRMGAWLENARDWAISRNRFWGTPLPVWICDQDKEHSEIMGSIKQLEERAGKGIEDIHLHNTKNINFSCKSCSGNMKPIDVVFDCWFESGSMPYAQLHYPFENKERFNSIFPADFVAEGLDQTRGWFYTLNVLSNALFDKPAFKNVIVNGVILDESGKKMSKRHRNYTPPDDLIDKYGADSVRLYMLNSPLLRAEDLIFTDQGVKEITRAVLLPLWNAFSFLSTYANADGWKPSENLLRGESPALNSEMDRWIVSKMHSLIHQVEDHMQGYKLYLVVPAVLSFIEDLTNWYIRLNRRRFWGAEGNAQSDQEDAYATLFHVLLQFSKVFAPFAPFLSDYLYRCLTESERSVHLEDMPSFDHEFQDAQLERRMELLKRTVNLGRSLRQKHKIKIRQVLPELMVITRHDADKDIVRDGSSLLKNELNVKKISFSTDEAKHIRLSLKPNLRTLGRRLGKQLNGVRSEILQISQSHARVSELLDKLAQNGSVAVGEHSLTEEDFLIERGPLDDRLIATESGVTVLLDTHLSEDLIAEGYAREIVNRIQSLRKESQLEVSDRIKLQIQAPAKLEQAIEEHKNYISTEVLAKRLDIIAMDRDNSLKFSESYTIEEMQCMISLEID